MVGLLGVGDDKRLGKVLGMDRSGFGAVVRGGAGWEDVADEAVSVRTFYLLFLPFILIPKSPTHSILLPYFLSFKKQQNKGSYSFFSETENS